MVPEQEELMKLFIPHLPGRTPIPTCKYFSEFIDWLIDCSTDWLIDYI